MEKLLQSKVDYTGDTLKLNWFTSIFHGSGKCEVHFFPLFLQLDIMTIPMFHLAGCTATMGQRTML